MPKVTFIGLGLDSERGITLEGLDAARNASSVFAEFYTNLMPNLDLANLEQLVGKKVTVLNRQDIEDSHGKDVLLAAKEGDVTVLVPGDPMVATTHVALGLARVGARDQLVKAARLDRLSKQTFGGPPQVMVFPSKLHFMEAEALKVFCGAEDADLEGTA